MKLSSKPSGTKYSTRIANNVVPKKKVSFSSNVTVTSFNKTNSNISDRRFTNSSIHLGTLNRKLGQKRFPVLSETRNAFVMPNNKKAIEAKRLASKIAEYNAKHPTKFQEHPPFSLRKTIPPGNKNKVIDAAKAPGKKQDEEELRRQLEPKERIVFVDKGLSCFATPHNPGPAFNSFGYIDDPIRDFLEKDDDRFRFIVDMSGFHNSELTFKLKERTLHIEGIRAKGNPWFSARTAMETVQLPGNVRADNLRVYRDSEGLMYFKEAWKF